MGDILALRLDGNRFVPCEHVGPRMLVPEALPFSWVAREPLYAPRPRVYEYGGNIVALPGGVVVVYVPVGEPFDVERHRPAILAALGRCNACANLVDEHNDEDRATCAEILREIAADEVHHGR